MQRFLDILALDSGIHESRENGRRHQELSPLSVIGGSRPSGYYFRERLTLFLERCHVVPNGDQHVVVIGQSGLISNRSVPWNDDRLICDNGQVPLGCRDHSVDVDIVARDAALTIVETMPVPVLRGGGEQRQPRPRISARNHLRRSDSSIQFSIKLVVATSPCLLHDRHTPYTHGGSFRAEYF
jgi:hypothetical protein